MLALHALFGRLRQARDFEEALTADLVIESRHRRLKVATDGEISEMQTPLRYRIRPASLRVAVLAAS
jgi:diacylglycerol kinase family enzyme